MAAAAGASREREARSEGSRNKRANRQKKKHQRCFSWEVSQNQQINGRCHSQQWVAVNPVTHMILLALPRPSFVLITAGTHTHTFTHKHTRTRCNSHRCDSKQHPSCAHNAPLQGEGGERQHFMQSGGNINTMWSKRCCGCEEGSLNAPLGANLRGVR